MPLGDGGRGRKKRTFFWEGKYFVNREAECWRRELKVFNEEYLICGGKEKMPKTDTLDALDDEMKHTLNIL